MSARDQFARRDRVNDMIRFSPLRVIGPDNEQLGVIPLDEAKRIAYDQGLDLVEVSPDARPPVCKIMDYGRYKYEQSKKDRKSSSGSKKSELKEVRLGKSLKIDPHDVDMRVNQARAFLIEGHKVQFMQPMRGREFQYRDQGMARMKEIEQKLSDISKVEVPPRFTGRFIMMIVTGDRTKIQAFKRQHPSAVPNADQTASGKSAQSHAHPSSSKDLADEHDTESVRPESSADEQTSSPDSEVITDSARSASAST